jgi:hypothetical protein
MVKFLVLASVDVLQIIIILTIDFVIETLLDNQGCKQFSSELIDLGSLKLNVE